MLVFPWVRSLKSAIDLIPILTNPQQSITAILQADKDEKFKTPATPNRIYLVSAPSSPACVKMEHLPSECHSQAAPRNKNSIVVNHLRSNLKPQYYSKYVLKLPEKYRTIIDSSCSCRCL
ncbi:hypothetical protein QUB63_30280 [Microcoleus sp. ARI1-B5]